MEQMITKICTKCGEEKELSEFHKDNSTKLGYRSRCKTCVLIYSKDYRNNNKEAIAKRFKLWKENNKDRRIETIKKWKGDNKLKVNISNTKRKRNFGYVPLNEKFPGSVGHHISKDLVIFIPEELHKSISHRQGDSISMGQINILALEYL